MHIIYIYIYVCIYIYMWCMYSCVYCILYVFAESILRTTSCWRPPNSKKELQHRCIRKWKLDVIDLSNYCPIFIGKVWVQVKTLVAFCSHSNSCDLWISISIPSGTWPIVGVEPSPYFMTSPDSPVYQYIPIIAPSRENMAMGQN